MIHYRALLPRRGAEMLVADRFSLGFVDLSPSMSSMRRYRRKPASPLRATRTPPNTASEWYLFPAKYASTWESTQVEAPDYVDYRSSLASFIRHARRQGAGCQFIDWPVFWPAFRSTPSVIKMSRNAMLWYVCFLWAGSLQIFNHRFSWYLS